MRSSVLLSVLTSALMFPSLALAWCRTTTCAAAEDTPAECNPGEVIAGCQMSGTALFWPKHCVSFSVQKDGSENEGITAAQLEQIVRTSFDNWENVDCGAGAHPNMAIETYPRVECAEARYNQKGPNQNVWLFRDDEWPHVGDGDRTIALTLVSFNPKTGEIYDVDVELNAVQRKFVLEPPTGIEAGEVDDLHSVVQHESGHFLGLAHSSDNLATMWSNYNGSADMRTLEADDALGFCAAYPPATSAGSCDAEPRHGFSTDCTKPPSDSCAMAPGSPSERRRGLAAMLAVVLGLGLRRRKRAVN